MSDNRVLYLHDLRSDVDGSIYTKQFLNLLCIVYLSVSLHNLVLKLHAMGI